MKIAIRIVLYYLIILPLKFCFIVIVFKLKNNQACCPWQIITKKELQLKLN